MTGVTRPHPGRHTVRSTPRSWRWVPTRIWNAPSDRGGPPGSLQRLRAADGGYANHPDIGRDSHRHRGRRALLRHLGAAIRLGAGLWLLARHRPAASSRRATPVPDLLSTATALHALVSLHVPSAVREPCLDFLDSLWTNRGGFYGTWADDTVDCEYTYYALLALGHLSLEPS